MLINTTINTNITVMIKKTNHLAILLLSLSILAACSISPGLQPIKSGHSFSGEEVFRDSKNNIVQVQVIDNEYTNKHSVIPETDQYKISSGDVLNVIVWGYPEIFPIINVNDSNPINARTVDNQGEIFFPYIGQISVVGKTVSEIRLFITDGLSKAFNDPQVDVTISKFNERRKIYVIGEVSQPIIIDMKLEAITLSDALGQAKGISVTTSNSDAIYLVRMSNEKPTIYKLDISDPTGFHNASKFYLQPQDLIFVGASDVTRWNRVIAQVFPFASFLNAIDNLTSSDS